MLDDMFINFSIPDLVFFFSEEEWKEIEDIPIEDIPIGIYMNTALPIIFLKKHLNASWNGDELTVKTPNGGQQSIAKIEKKSLKSVNGTYNVHKRLSVRTRFYQDDPRKMGWSTYADFDKEAPTGPIRETAEQLALHAFAVPLFTEYCNNYESYSQYLQDKDVFIYDLVEFLHMDSELIRRFMINKNLPYSSLASYHLQLFEHLFGKTPGVTFKTSLREINFDLKTLANDSKNGANMSERSKPNFKNHVKAIVQDGLARGAVNAVSEKAVEAGLSVLGDRAPAVLNTEGGHAAIQAMFAMMFMSALEFPAFAARVPPELRAQFEKVLQLQLSGAVAKGSEAAIAEFFDVGVPLFQEYLKAAAMIELPDSEFTHEQAELDLDEVPAMRQRERASAKEL